MKTGSDERVWVEGHVLIVSTKLAKLAGFHIIKRCKLVLLANVVADHEDGWPNLTGPVDNRIIVPS